jgi:Cof subfamily protein (haloacid dehalogenase superfamily)
MPTVTRDRFDALVLDLDGTLLDGRGHLTPRARDAVGRARDVGYVVILATGRSLAGTRDVHKELGLDTPVCAYNGAWVGPAEGGAPWHYAPIPDGLVHHVGRVEDAACFHFRHHGEHKYTARVATDHHRRVAGWYRNVVEVEPGVRDFPQRDLLRVSVFFDGEAATDAAWNALSPTAREGLHREVFPLAMFPDFEDLGLWLCEVQRRGRGKAEALRWLSEVRGIPASRVVAAGDQANDLPLLRDAGLAVAMGNAVPAVMGLAHVVVGHHRDEGLARWLEDEVA